MALWELIPDVSVSWDVPSVQHLPTGPSTYGDRVEQDLFPSAKSTTFRGRGLTLSEVNALISARSRGSAYTVTDYKGNTHTGTLLSVAYSVLQGTVLHTVTITLRT